MNERLDSAGVLDSNVNVPSFTQPQPLIVIIHIIMQIRSKQPSMNAPHRKQTNMPQCRAMIFEEELVMFVGFELLEGTGVFISFRRVGY
jgi:hypothetical protein